MQDTSADILTACQAQGLPLVGVANEDGTLEGVRFDWQPGITPTDEQIAQAQTLAAEKFHA